MVTRFCEIDPQRPHDHYIKQEIKYNGKRVDEVFLFV